MQGKEKAEERETAVGMGQSKGATQIIFNDYKYGVKKVAILLGS